MVVVIPMAGRGSRYADSGYELPKPLIEVAGMPMVLWALKSLEHVQYHRIVFVTLREHEVQFGVSRLLKGATGKPTDFVFLDDVTEGQLCTVLEAKAYFESKDDILIAASDSYIKSTLGQSIDHKDQTCAGLISVISLQGDQWSFARADEKGKVSEVAEKTRISNHCSTGLYYFTNASDLVEIGTRMIEANERTRNEFYVIPVYQKMIDRGQNIYISQAQHMWDMGTPEAKEKFERQFKV